MISVQELYALWATEDYAAIKASLAESLAPRRSEWLYQVFADLGPVAQWSPT